MTDPATSQVRAESPSISSPDGLAPSENPHKTDIVALLIAIARALVDAPEKVSVDVLSDVAGSSVLRLRLGPGDIGKVIGRQGRTARSLRTILSAAGMKAKQRYSLDIVEDESIAPA